MAEQVILEFVGDPSGLKPLADAYKALGALTDEQVKEFDKVNEKFKQTDTLAKSTEKSVDKLADSFKKVNTTVAGKGIADMGKNLKLVDVDIAKMSKRLEELALTVGKEDEEFKQLAKTIGQYKARLVDAERAVNIYAKSTDALSTALGELEDRLYDLALAGQQDTQEFKDLTAEVVRMKTAIKDVDTQVDRLVERQNAFTTLSQNVQLVGTAFMAVQGAAALVGDENEDLQQTLVKLNAVMAISQSIEQARTVLLEQQRTRTGLYAIAIKAKTLALEFSSKAVTFFGNASAAAWAKATLGLSILITAVIALAMNFEKIGKAIGFISDENDGLNKKLQAQLELQRKLREEQEKRNEDLIKTNELELDLLNREGAEEKIKLQKQLEILEKVRQKDLIKLIELNQRLDNLRFISAKERAKIGFQEIENRKAELAEEIKLLEIKDLQTEADIKGINKKISEIKKATKDAEKFNKISLDVLIAPPSNNSNFKRAADLFAQELKKSIEKSLNDIPDILSDKLETKPLVIDVELKRAIQSAQFKKAFRDSIDEIGLEATQLISDTIFEANRERREREFQQLQEDLNMRRDMELNNEDLTEAQRLAIQEKYRRQEAAIKLQQWRKEQSSKATQAIINGSLAATLAIATIPPPGGQVAAFQNILFAGIQAAAILAKKPPAFAKGTKNAPEGMALVGEEGPELVHLKGGSKVITAPETKKILDKYQVPNIIKYDDVVKDSQGMNIIGIDPDAVAKAVAREIAKQDRVSINIDEKGFVKYLLGQRNKTELINRKFKMN